MCMYQPSRAMETVWRISRYDIHFGGKCGLQAAAAANSSPSTTWHVTSVMKVTSRFLSHLRLDQTYCLLSARNVSVALEFFKAIDIRGEMALDGTAISAYGVANRALS